MSSAETQADDSIELPDPSPEIKGGDDELKAAAQALVEKFEDVWGDNDTTVTKIERGTEPYHDDLTVKLTTGVASANTAANALEDTAFEFENMIMFRGGTIGIQANYIDEISDEGTNE